MSTQTLIATSQSAPPLTAKLAPWMTRLIARPEVAASLLNQHGSPAHVVVADELKRNASDLLSPLNERGVQGGLFFARKANKLAWFVTAAKECGLGVDTASLTEVRETLQLGVPGEKIVVTAIGKDQTLLSEAINSGCMIVIDNLDEIDQISAVAKALNKSARVGLRFAGFNVGDRKVYSRFGLPVEEFSQILGKVIALAPTLQLKILHAHLDRYDTVERALAARKLLQIADHARELGVAIDAIDMGGGILIRYLESAEQWSAFQQALVDGVRGVRPSCTFRGDGLGYYMTGDTLAGNADLYPAYNKLSKERFIAAILDHEVGSIPLHKELSGRGIKLFFEPGRALLDNTGVTLAKVTFRKRDTEGNMLVGLGINRTNLRPFRAEFCCDPIALTGGRQPCQDGVFFVGNLCGEGDIIYRRRLHLDTLPETGDIFLFPNTAGYLAHHLEVGTHGDPLPANVLLDPESLAVVDRTSR